MIRLSLFARSDPQRLLAQREMRGGEMLIGRGEDADWVLDDPERLLSRHHCSVKVTDGSATVTDLSANGVFLDDDAERCARGEDVPLRSGQVLRLGDYLIAVAQRSQPEPLSSQSSRPPLVLVDAAAQLSRVAGDSEDTRADSSDHGALLEAFCSAAHLDVSAFADEDSAAIMQRLGGVYRQMVIGLAELMSERTAAKSDLVAEHTTVGHVDNNPFRWASSQRLAVDLLRQDHEGFMTGPEAVRASFGDIKQHLSCISAGMRTALQSMLDFLSPKTIEGRLEGRSPLLPGYKSAAWTAYVAAHEELRREAQDGAAGRVQREFRNGYAASLSELDSGSDR